MADNNDASDKSFEASSRKLDDLRKKGEIPRSADLLVGLSYLGMFLALYQFGGRIFENGWVLLQESWGQTCVYSSHMCVEAENTFPAWGLGPFIFFLSSIVGISFSFVIVALVVTRGIVFSPKNISPKLNRISILQNAKNKFGVKGIFEFVKNFSKLLIYSAFCYFFVVANFDQILGLIYLGDRVALAAGMSLVLRLIGILAVVALIIGGVDYLWQFNHFKKKNRMSHKDMRDEQKEAEGDPYFKQARVVRSRDIALNQMLRDVEKSDVIIVNPTHYSVALKWSKRPGEAPVCVGKGVDHVALKIREVARETGVPIYEDAPTARALYANLDLDMEIDPEFYVPVAAAIRYATDLKNKIKSRGF